MFALIVIAHVRLALELLPITALPALAKTIYTKELALQTNQIIHTAKINLTCVQRALLISQLIHSQCVKRAILI